MEQELFFRKHESLTVAQPKSCRWGDARALVDSANHSIQALWPDSSDEWRQKAKAHKKQREHESQITSSISFFVCVNEIPTHQELLPFRGGTPAMASWHHRKPRYLFHGLTKNSRMDCASHSSCSTLISSATSWPESLISGLAKIFVIMEKIISY